jgi:hypothetical protein
MATNNKGIKDPMKSGKDFGSPFDIFKAKLNKKTVESLKQPTGGLTGKKSKNSASPSVKLKKETLKKLAGNKTAVQKAKARAEAKAKSKSTTSKSKSAPRAVDKGGRLSARGSEGYKPTKTNMGPNMSKVNKPTKAKAKKSEAKKPEAKKFDRMKAARNQMKSARASMGFKKGGSIDGCATKGHTRAKRSR